MMLWLRREGWDGTDRVNEEGQMERTMGAWHKPSRLGPGNGDGAVL